LDCYHDFDTDRVGSLIPLLILSVDTYIHLYTWYTVITLARTMGKSPFGINDDSHPSQILCARRLRWFRVCCFCGLQAGPRMCLGKELAMIQMKMIAASVLQRFTFSVPDEFSPKYGLNLTMPMKNGLPVWVHPRHKN
jgi:hypothetical protein